MRGALVPVALFAVALTATPFGTSSDGSAAGSSEASPKRTAEEVIGLVEAAEDGFKDVHLRFTQVTTLKATAETQEMTGEITLLKSPERFLVRFVSPVAQAVGYDGSCLTMFFPETEQAFREKATTRDLTAFLGVNPASSVKSFREGYRPSLLGCQDGSCVLSFERTEPPGLVWTVKVSATTWYLEEAAFENDEVRVVLRCYDYEVNRGLSADALRLEMPRGTEVHDGIPQFFGGMEAP